MESRRGRARDEPRSMCGLRCLPRRPVSGEDGSRRTQQVVARRIGDESAVGTVIRFGRKNLGQARRRKEGMSAAAVLVLCTATGIPRLVSLAAVRFLGNAHVRVVMGVMTEMLLRSRNLLMQTIGCNRCGSPLQRQKQHEKDDRKPAHGGDCRSLQICRHHADFSGRDDEVRTRRSSCRTQSGRNGRILCRLGRKEFVQDPALAGGAIFRASRTQGR